MKKAHGAIEAKPFQRHRAHKLTRHRINTEQTLTMSGWDRLSTTSQKVDEDRVNWQGIVFMQQEYGMFDPRPRLVKR